MIHNLKHFLWSEVGLTVIAAVVVCLVIWAVASTAGDFVIRSEVMMRPENVRKRAMELQRQMSERRIAQIGEETRAAIQATAERRQRAGSVREQR